MDKADERHPAVVALMGSSMSDYQMSMIAEQLVRATVMLDGDEPGREATADIVMRFHMRFDPRIVEVLDGRQPDNLSPTKSNSFLSGDCFLFGRPQNGRSFVDGT